MSNIERGFIPLRKVEDEQPLETVVFSLGLPPFVDQDRIGVNLGRINRLQGIAGIRQITVTGQNSDTQSQDEVNIVGVNSDGSAIASKGKSKTTVPTYESNSFVRNDWVPMNQRQIILNIRANLDEISLRLTNSKDGVRSPKGWARELDSGIRQSIKKAGTDNLVRNIDSEVKFQYKFLAIWNLGWIALINTILLKESIQDFPKVYILSMITGPSIWNFLNMITDRQNPNLRKSIFLGPQFDRAIALRTLTASQKLVKDLRPDKK